MFAVLSWSVSGKRQQCDPRRIDLRSEDSIAQRGSAVSREKCPDQNNRTPQDRGEFLVFSHWRKPARYSGQ